MKITSSFMVNFKGKEAMGKVNSAAEEALKDVVSDIAADAIKGSPKETGNNARSIMFEVGPGGEVAKDKLEGAVYSTSGYGGYLETGTVNMSAQPYFKPALDKNIKNLPKKMKSNLGRGF